MQEEILSKHLGEINQKRTLQKDIDYAKKIQEKVAQL